MAVSSLSSRENGRDVFGLYGRVQLNPPPFLFLHNLVVVEEVEG